MHEEMELRQFHKTKITTMSKRFHVFFTPDFSTGPPFTKGPYKYNNKPNSVYLWMKDILGMNKTNRTKEVEDGIVILLDPDMVLLRPLLPNFSDQEILYASPSKTGSPRPHFHGTTTVAHGKPMAQQDGYLNSEWMHFNVSYITEGGTFPNMSYLDGAMYWNSGPPYLATVR
jgi:peptidyl serine alpha-galactosyltransferase